MGVMLRATDDHVGGGADVLDDESRTVFQVAQRKKTAQATERGPEGGKLLIIMLPPSLWCE